MNDQEKIEAIKKICKDRNITYCVHFTRIENLSSIIEKGLLPRTESNLLEITPLYNDMYRLDGLLNASSLSISFPNYKMFWSYRMNILNSQWVVICFKVDILWELPCAFCLHNAASICISSIPIENRMNSHSFDSLFSDLNFKGVSIERKYLNIPDYFTTNPQAEVLIFGTIDPKWILAVVFENQENYNSWRLNNNISIQPFIDWNYLFKPRSDYIYWKNDNFLI